MKINLLTFTPVAESIKLELFTEKLENSNPLRLFRNECPQFWEQHPELSDKEYPTALGCSVSHCPDLHLRLLVTGCFPGTIDLDQSTIGV